MSQKKSKFVRGHLYHHSQGATHNEIIISQKRYKTLPKIIGGGLASFALASMIYSYAPVSYVNIGIASETHSVQITNEKDSSAIDEAHALGINSDFSIAVPEISAYSNIIKNVDVSDESSYGKALKEGVAQASGTGFPGENRRMFLFAHSTNSLLNFEKYNAIFYELRKINKDSLIFIYYEDKKYIYKVTDKKVVAASDVSWLSPKEEPTLILQTCDPPGTSWKRLLVFAKLQAN